MSKQDNPTEFGAVLDGTGKKAVNCQMVTWLFLDADKGDDVEMLEESLRKCGIAYLIVESSSSRQGANPFKFHCYIPIEPITLASKAMQGIDWQRTVDITELWWRSVHKAARSVFAAVGNMRFDSAVDKLVQPTFVAHRPLSCGPEADRYTSWSDGKVLNISALLRAAAPLLGYRAEATVQPVAVSLLGAELATYAARATGRGVVGFENGDKGITQASPELTPVTSLGPTPNESTGTLVFKALDYFGMVGGKHDAESHYTLCPWREHHESAVRQGMQDNYDSSVLVFTHGSQAGEDGGFKCYHTGRGIAGECDQATAADVLRWARKRSAPIPNRPEWDMGAPLPVPPEVVQAEKSTSADVAFATAPDLRVEPESIDTSQFRNDDDYIGGFGEETAVPAAPSPEPTPLVEIEVSQDLVEQARLAIEVVAAHPKFYQRSNNIVDIVDEAPGITTRGRRRPKIRTTTKPYLHAVLSHYAFWYTWQWPKGSSEPIKARTRPDKDAVGAVLAAGQFDTRQGAFCKMRHLVDIIYTPVFRPNGTLLTEPGYDVSTGLLLRDETQCPSVQNDPTKTELRAALATILSPIKYFPFRNGGVDQAVWLSAVFTPFLRYVGEEGTLGCKPFFLVSANRAGGGKTKLVNLATLISDGRYAAMSGKMLGDDGELERIMGMHIEAGTPALCIDNIPIGVPLASPVLEAFITTPEYITRKIGTSLRIKASNFAGLLWGTGNGAETGGDMLRRTLRIDIEDQSENPANRYTGDEVDIETKVKADRAMYVHAVLTLLSGFFAARARGHIVTLPAGGFGSFDGWSATARSAVVWCGLPDPVYARGREVDDSMLAGLRHLVNHLRTCCPQGDLVGNIARLLVKNRSSVKRDNAVAAFDGHLVDEGLTLNGQSGDSSKLGKHLKTFSGLVVFVDDKRWQLRVTKRASGSFVDVVEVTK